MPDPATHTASAIIVASSSAAAVGTTTALAGTLFGLEWVVYGIAILGAATAHLRLEKMPPWQMFWSIMISFGLGCIVSRLFTQIAVETVTHYFEFLRSTFDKSSPTDNAMIVAFIVSFSAQKVVPFMFSKIELEPKP